MSGASGLAEHRDPGVSALTESESVDYCTGPSLVIEESWGGRDKERV